MAKIRPLAGYCLILPINKEEQYTASGMLLPEKAKEKPMKGKVIGVGSPIIHYENRIPEAIKKLNTDLYSLEEEYCQVKEGDTVIFYRWGGQTIREGDKEYLLVKFSDIQAIYD